MKYIIKNIKLHRIVIIFFTIIFSAGTIGPAAAYYGFSPAWSQSIDLRWGGYPMYANFSGYESFYNPYAYGPPPGVYPYNSMFDIYSGGYNMSAGYNQNFMGYYNSANYAGYGRQDINAIGYPLPYAYTDQRAWGNQLNYAMGYLGAPLTSGSYISTGNPPLNVYYNPGAFTVDLGLAAQQQGVINFWKGIFQRLDEEEEEK